MILRLLFLVAPLLVLGCDTGPSGEWTEVSSKPKVTVTASPPPSAVPTATSQKNAGLTADEMAFDAAPEDLVQPSVTLDEASSLKIEFLTESGYLNSKGEQMIDLLEQDYAYLVVRLTTEDGRPVAGAAPQLSIEGSSRIMPMTESEAGTLTDADGLYEFAVIGGQMNLDRLNVAVADETAQLLINIISLDAAGYPSPDDVEAALPWSKLAQLEVDYADDGSLLAEFSKELAQLNGTQVTLAGFMMPLEPEQKQKHFLLTSSPPSCFFHLPGGPAGAVEVLAPKGIDATWDLLVLDGRLETIERSEMGVVYRLHDAKVSPQ